MNIYYEPEDLDILESCLDMALLNLEHEKRNFGDIAHDLDRDIDRTLELRNRIRKLRNVETGSFVVFTRYEIYLLVEIICDILNLYKEEDYPLDTIKRIMTAQKPLFENIIHKHGPSLFLYRKEKEKAS